MKLKKLLSGFIFGAFGLGISLAVFTGSVPNILTRGSTITAVNPNAYIMTQSGNEQGRITVANLFTSAGSGMYLPLAGNTIDTLQNDIYMDESASIRWIYDSIVPNLIGYMLYNNGELTLLSESDGVQNSKLIVDNNDGVKLYYADSGFQNEYSVIFNGSGLAYGDDYSSIYTERTLVDKGYVEQKISGLLTYKGAWDISTGVFPSSPRTGDYYVFVAGGTGGSTYYGTGDMIIANKKVTGATNSADWDHIVNTVRPEVDPIFTANSGVYFNANSGTYFNANSGTYYTTNPLGYITGGALSGFITGGQITGNYWTKSGTVLFYTGGNVGIGTTNPNAPLQVSGYLNFKDSDVSTYMGLNAGLNTKTNSFYNTAFGYEAMKSDTNTTSTSQYNSAFGANTLKNNRLGTFNTAFGFQTLLNNLDGSFNTSFGSQSLEANTSGNNNTNVGSFGLQFIAGLSSNNVALGYQAGRYYSTNTQLTSASGSIFIGSNTRANANNSTNEIVIGDNMMGNGNNTVTIGNSNTSGTYLKGNVYLTGIGVMKDTNNNPYITGVTSTGTITRPGNTEIPNSTAVVNYIEAMSQNLGDIITTGGFYISGATNNRRTIESGTTYSIQNSTSLLGPWNEVGYFGIGNILFNKHLAVGGYNPYYSGDAMQVSGTSWFMKNIPGGMIQGGFAVNVGVLNIGMFGYHPSGVGIYGSTDFGIGVYGEANPLYTGSIGGYFKGPGLSGSAITAEGTINLTGGFAPFRFAYSGSSVVAQFYTGGNRVSATAFTLP